MFFTEKNRKKNLIIFLLVLPLFCGALFLLQTHSVDAGGPTATAQAASAQKASADASNKSYNPFVIAMKWLLYGVFVLMGWFGSVALTLFEWVIKPENYSGTTGVLNQPVVYEMWKFIRDFFNLFFILVLLYIAFMVVFQMEKNFKKTLLSLVLAALFINFSYPVSRALIDVTNVPMYFFANQMATGNNSSAGAATTVFSSVLSASKIKGILLPGAVSKKGEFDSDTVSIPQLLAAIIFMFLFSVTLLVLAVMFVVRLVALVILVIFSSVGFAASIVPGLSSYSKMWWENFWKYTFFGPAAMLMLLVSVRFFSALGDEKTGIFKNVVDTSTDKVVNDPTFFASMALFSVPIIMLWMAMGLAQTFSIAGASSVVGMGKKFSSWAGNKTLNGGKWLAYKNPIARGVGSGLKERAENNKVLKFATPKYWKDSGQQRAERIAGYVGDGSAGRSHVIENQHNKKVAEAEKKMEEERINDGQLFDKMNNVNGKPAEREAAARVLSKRDKLSDSTKIDQAAAAMAAANTSEVAQEKTAELVKKAGGEIYTDGAQLEAAIGRLGGDTKAIAALIDKASGAALGDIDINRYDALTNQHPDPVAFAAATPAQQADLTAEAARKSAAIKAKLDGKLKKDGKTDVLIRAEVRANPAGGPMIAGMNAVSKVLKGMSNSEIVKQQMFSSSDPDILAAAQSHLTLMRISNPEKYQKIRAELP